MAKGDEVTVRQGAIERMPAEVDESKARATMKDGILELTLPKLEKSTRRTIRVD